jgi:SRSO17 transposase
MPYISVAVPFRTRIVKERWRTKQAYEELKGELGLDHFEGRSFPGWHHHVTVVLCCYAFVVAERARHFPPPPEGKRATTRSTARPERHFASRRLVELKRLYVGRLEHNGDQVGRAAKVSPGRAG